MHIAPAPSRSGLASSRAWHTWASLRQSQDKGRPPPFPLRFGPELTAVALGKFSREEEPHPDPPLRLREALQCPLVDPVETFENRLQLVVRESDSGVAHPHDRIVNIGRWAGWARARHDGDHDLPTLRRIADRIRQQVDDDLFDSIAIPVADECRHLGLDDDRMARRAFADLRRRLADQRDEIEEIAA
jgi:hypothetical protein